MAEIRNYTMNLSDCAVRASLQRSFRFILLRKLALAEIHG